MEERTRHHRTGHYSITLVPRSGWPACPKPLLCVRLAALAVLARLASHSLIQIHHTLLFRPPLITEIATERAKRAGRQSYQRGPCIVRDGRRKRRLVEATSRMPAIDELVVRAAAILHLSPAVHNMRYRRRDIQFLRQISRRGRFGPIAPESGHSGSYPPVGIAPNK
jgi:hypothetical protein